MDLYCEWDRFILHRISNQFAIPVTELDLFMPRRLEGEAQTGDLGDEGGIDHEDVGGRHLKPSKRLRNEATSTRLPLDFQPHVGSDVDSERRHGAGEAAVVLSRVAALDVRMERIFRATVQFAARELEGLPESMANQPIFFVDSTKKDGT